MSQTPGESLAAMLTIEAGSVGAYHARLENFWGASLHGDLLARVVMAAGATGAGHALHSLHASFLRPAPPDVALTLSVQSLGAEPGCAQQVLVRGDELLCHAVAHFAAADTGVAYQTVPCETDLPPPETLRSTADTARAEGWADYAHGPIEFRRVRPAMWPDAARDNFGTHIEWVRPRRALPNDGAVHGAALVFLSGFYNHWPFERRIGGFAHDRFQPLTHALWVHRGERWEDWWLLHDSTEIAHGGRALGLRRIFTRRGDLIATRTLEARVAGTST